MWILLIPRTLGAQKRMRGGGLPAGVPIIAESPHRGPLNDSKERSWEPRGAGSSRTKGRLQIVSKIDLTSTWREGVEWRKRSQRQVANHMLRRLQVWKQLHWRILWGLRITWSILLQQGGQMWLYEVLIVKKGKIPYSQCLWHFACPMLSPYFTPGFINIRNIHSSNCSTIDQNTRWWGEIFSNSLCPQSGISPSNQPHWSPWHNQEAFIRSNFGIFPAFLESGKELNSPHKSNNTSNRNSNIVSIATSDPRYTSAKYWYSSRLVTPFKGRRRSSLGTQASLKLQRKVSQAAQAMKQLVWMPKSILIHVDHDIIAAICSNQRLEASKVVLLCTI